MDQPLIIETASGHHRTAGTPTRAAHFTTDARALVVDRLSIADRDVLVEARRWTTGERGPMVDDEAELVEADLSTFVTEAVRLGAHALSVTGQAHEAKAIERILKEVADRTADSTSQAAAATEQLVQHASTVVVKAAAEARETITQADAQSRKEIITAVSAAKSDLNAEVNRIFGGESPELLERLRPLLDRFGSNLDKQMREGSTELLEKVAKQFDPSDPTSPMAKHAAALTEQNARLATQWEKQQAEITRRLDDINTAVKVQVAKEGLARATTIKGLSFEAQVHSIVHDIASGLGDEYTESGTIVGKVARSKKGDGVLCVDGGTARVVLEMTDSPRTTWSEYFTEAERNREATAALGLVRSPEQNGGQTIRVLGPRRIVLAFDPDTDDRDLLRTVLMLLRVAAISANGRTGAPELATAEEKVTEAIAQLDRIDAIKKSAGMIQKHALSIEGLCGGITTDIRRLLDAAQVALRGAAGAGSAAAEVADLSRVSTAEAA